jgi:uncharacterized protein (DUF433 family)
MQNLTRITRNPEVMGGKPCIRGMRVTVGVIVDFLLQGNPIKGVANQYWLVLNGNAN